MGLGDLVPDVVEDAVEDGAELAGEVIDEGGDLVAGGLDKVGWESGADWVREKSDSVANALGADVDEMQLGDTEDPKKLVHGSPGKLRSTAGHLSDFKTAFTKVGNGLKGLDSSALKGEAADAFREKVSIEPRKWFKAADACEKAAGALRDFAGTVEWAQGQAQTAIDKYKKGKKASEDARDAYNGKVDAYNAAVDAYNAEPADKRDPDSLPARPGAFHDPGQADIDEAHEILKEARSQRNEAHTKAERAVAAARDEAPEKPSYGEQFQDGIVGLSMDVSHFYGGIIKGTAGVVNFARSVNPADPYNLTHPAEYLTSLNSTAAGLVRMTNDPLGTAQTMWDSFKKDPAEGFGRLVPELVGTRGLGSIKKVATAARLTPDGPPPGHTALKTDGPDAHSTPDGGRPSGDTDPVDLATGKMYLPQTDVALPGVLPLVFNRRVESGYRAGRWFGEQWVSTVDQRLEVAAESVVLVAEDGRLLAFPHPAPGLPTLPTAGAARMELERTEDGGYVLTDPETGWVRHFSPPGGPDAEPGADGDALLERITDRNGHRIDFEHDADGAPVRIVHDGGYELLLTTDAGRITALHLAGPDEAVPLVRYGYTDGDLTEVVNSSGLPLRFTYDDEGRVTSWTDTNDRRYDYVYDNRDRCILEGGTEGHVQVRIAYGAPDERTGHRTTTVTDAQGHARRYVIDDRCRVVAETDPLGNTVRTSYDPHGRPLTRTDALGRTTGYHYDEQGRLTSIIRPDGRASHAEYGEPDLPLSVTGTDGTTWRYGYDERGNRTSVTDPAGHTTRHTYDDRGHLASVVNALGETTSVRCDAAGLPVEITDPLGGVTRYDRDAFGRPIALTDPLGAVTRLEWTTEGKLARHVDPAGLEQSWVYDGEGNCTAYTDADGRVSSYEYTHFDRLAAQTGPDGARYEFAYDASLQLTRVTGPQGLTWTYEYDPAGRLVAETDFDDRTLRYTHDAAGRLVSRTNPLGQAVSFERDELGRIVRKDADGRVTDYVYDAVGRLASARGPDAELVHQRDRLGRVKSEMVDGRVLTHTYDPVGRRVSRVTPSGARTTFSYDAAGNRTALNASGHTLQFTHDAAGRETGRRIGGRLELTRMWDPAGRLTGQTLLSQGPQGPDLVQQRAYSYRDDGHLVGVRDHLAGSASYDLDAAGRVTSVRAEGWSETYAYDEAGNQTRAEWPAAHGMAEAVGTRTYNGTSLRTAGRIRYEYDDAGRVVLRQKARLSKKPDTWRYSWDAEDRLTEVATPDGTVWRYLYDPLGRRIAKLRMAGEQVLERVDFTWDGSTLVEQTGTAPQQPHPVTLTWDHDGLIPLAQTERVTDATTQAEIDSRFFAIVTDLVGTPTELVDESGDIAWRARATLWGTTAWTADCTAYTPLRFPGQYFDPETGLHYNHHRYYDPATARYASPDPLGLGAAPNPAAYVPNPHRWVDPLGLAPCVPGQQRGTAPSFVVDGNGAAQDVRHLGRPDDQMVFSGHGGIRAGDGAPVTVPDGTSVHMYSRHGETISDHLGNQIETGNPKPVEVYGPGEQLPDYSLFPPDNPPLNILGEPRNLTVTQETYLSQLLQPNMGPVHWAACREVF